MKYQHFIVTRFNQRAGRDAPLVSDDWMEDRFELFERVCLPSVEAQTNQGFRLVLCCDGRTRPEHKRILEGYEATARCRVGVVYDAPCAGLVTRWIEPDTEFVVTTRLDNDDAVSDGMIAAAQSWVEQLDPARADPAFIVFPRGLCLDTSGRCVLLDDPDNPFATMIERRSEPLRTIYHINHTKIRETYPGLVTLVKAEPMWLRYCHGRNIANRMESFAARGALYAGDLDRFHLRLDVARRQ